MSKLLDKKPWKFLRKLTHKYRMVLLNEDTYEEVGTMRLTRLNLFTFAGVLVILLVAIVYSLVAFTNIREQFGNRIRHKSPRRTNCQILKLWCFQLAPTFLIDKNNLSI